MDRSHELWSLVEAARGTLSSVPPDARKDAVAAAAVAQQASLAASFYAATQPMRAAAQTIEVATAETLHSATVRIRDLLVALDSNTTASTTQLMSHLLLSEAELLSVATSIKELTEHLQRVPLQRETSWGADLIAHQQQAASILAQRVAAARLKVSLAKEELSLFKGEMHLFGAVGVLSCSDTLAAELRQRRDDGGGASGVLMQWKEEGEAAGDTWCSVGIFLRLHIFSLIPFVLRHCHHFTYCSSATLSTLLLLAMYFWCLFLCFFFFFFAIIIIMICV